LGLLGRMAGSAVQNIRAFGAEHRTVEELRRLSADPEVKSDERTVVERGSDEVRSIFEVHKISDAFADLVRDPRVAGPAKPITRVVRRLFLACWESCQLANDA
jgi:hypothetical protein